MSEEEQQQAPELVGPGALLKQAREKAGLSIDDIANKLHLKVANIESIEADRVDESISLTFTKGYLKLYAKQVNLAEDAVLEAFEKLNTQAKEPAKLQSFSRRVARQANDDRLMLVTYLIVALVVALVVVWWLQQSDKDSTSLIDFSSSPASESQQAASEPAEASTNQLLPVAEAATSAELQITEQQAAELAGQVEQSSPVPAATEDAAPNTEQPLESTPDGRAELTEDSNESDTATLVLDQASSAEPGEVVELVFQFSGDCWMNLTDATGEAIAYGVKDSGRVMPVSGLPPFQVTLGAPEVVQISYNGEPVDMSRFRAGRTAKFSLPLAE